MLCLQRYPLRSRLKCCQCLLDNIAAADIQLSEDEIALVRKLAEEGDAIPGDRFPPGWRVHAYPSNPPLEGHQV